MIDMTHQEAVALLENARLGRLGMIDAAGRPYTIPLRFVWTDDAVYMRLAPCGRKGDALERNNHVCFEVDTCANDLSDYGSVLIEGAVVEVADPVEKEEALYRYHEKYGRLCGLGVPPRPVTINGVVLRKLLPEKISGRKREPDDCLLAILPRPLTPPLALPRRKRARARR